MLALPIAAYAQKWKHPEEPKVDLEDRKAKDKAYNDALSRIQPKNPKEEYDPWAGVREKAPAEKPSAPKKKPAR
jgi:hypothetical protein